VGETIGRKQLKEPDTTRALSAFAEQSLGIFGNDLGTHELPEVVHYQSRLVVR
jgi:hypothetical protein